MKRISAAMAVCLLCHPLLAIVNGHDADQPSATIALELREDTADGPIYHKGSGVLFSAGSRWVLTAAHNVRYLPDPRAITAIFSAAPHWTQVDAPETRIAAARAIWHPRFQQIPGGTEFDLALVRLERPIPPGYPTAALAAAGTPLAGPLTLFGYGTDRDGGDSPLSAFRRRTIDLAPPSPEYRLGDAPKFWLDQHGGGICGGDSGGPALVDGRVAGIATHVTYEGGQEHCLTRGAFTDVTYFASWIEAQLAGADAL